MPGIEVRRGGPADATREMAVGVAIVQRDAYAARFPGCDVAELEDRLDANPFNDEHIDTTQALLRMGPEDGWFWSFAVSRDMGYAAVHGFALAAALKEEIALMEVHVHPHSQRSGLGRRLAQISIKDAMHDPKFAGSWYDTPISLYVARQRPNDFSEHPARWYRRLGFSATGAGQPFVVGDLQLVTEHMEAPVGDVLAQLETY